MDIHEFQAKQLFERKNIPVPPFWIVENRDEAKKMIEESFLNQAVVKIQVHAGGRGKGGGVKIGLSQGEILSFVDQLLGMKLINSQTGPDGLIASKLLITPLIEFVKEYYIAVLIDRRLGKRVLIVSAQGGVEIEETLSKRPDQALKIEIPSKGILRNYHWIEIEKLMSWEGETFVKGKETIKNLIELFIEIDASILEINPLVLGKDGRLWALDGKISIDDNALFRQKEIQTFYDPKQLNFHEAQAKEEGFSYVSMDGDVGCMVNGAGLAMATLDLIQLHGGKPANFLDIGGSASKEKISQGFKLILEDEKVKKILVNIFGGIMNCETLALGMIEAMQNIKKTLPLIIRMEGTHMETAKKMLQNAAFETIFADTLEEAAEKAVHASCRS